MTPEAFLHALAMTETVSHAEAWGDYDSTMLPLAMGRWQFHPARLYELATKHNLPPTTKDSWDSWARRVETAEFIARTAEGRTPLEIAMDHHLGHWGDPKSNDWDAHYAKRFQAYANKELE